MLKLEPTSHCNLECPVCPVVTNFEEHDDLREQRRRRILPTEAMIDVVAQLPELEQILYFNFGHFSHQETLRSMERFAREVMPHF